MKKIKKKQLLKLISSFNEDELNAKIEISNLEEFVRYYLEIHCMKKTEKLMDKKPKDKYVLYSEFNEFRKEMYVFKSEFNQFRDEITSRIDNLESRIDARIDNLETRIDNLENRIDARMDSLETRMGNLETRIDNLEVNISKILTILESK